MEKQRSKKKACLSILWSTRCCLFAALGQPPPLRPLFSGMQSHHKSTTVQPQRTKTHCIPTYSQPLTRASGIFIVCLNISDTCLTRVSITHTVAGAYPDHIKVYSLLQTQAGLCVPTPLRTRDHPHPAIRSIPYQDRAQISLGQPTPKNRRFCIPCLG